MSESLLFAQEMVRATSPFLGPTFIVAIAYFVFDHEDKKTIKEFEQDLERYLAQKHGPDNR